MTPTPDDIRKARSIAVDVAYSALSVDTAAMKIAQALAEEREAERERCAGIAEGFDRRGREWVPDSLWDRVRRETAAEIRSGRAALASTDK